MSDQVLRSLTNEQLLGSLLDARDLNDTDDDEFDRKRTEVLRRMASGSPLAEQNATIAKEYEIDTNNLPELPQGCYMCETEGEPVLYQGRWIHADFYGNMSVRDCRKQTAKETR